MLSGPETMASLVKSELLSASQDGGIGRHALLPTYGNRFQLFHRTCVGTGIEKRGDKEKCRGAGKRQTDPYTEIHGNREEEEP